MSHVIEKGIVMAINFARSGRKTAALITVLVSVVATAALLPWAVVLSDDLDVPSSFSYIPQLVSSLVIGP